MLCVRCVKNGLITFLSKGELYEVRNISFDGSNRVCDCYVDFVVKGLNDRNVHGCLIGGTYTLELEVI